MSSTSSLKALGVSIVMASAAARPFNVGEGLYGYTGFEDQQDSAVAKTSVFKFDALEGDVQFIVNVDEANAPTKPHGDKCEAGQAAKMAGAKGVIFGTAGIDDAPLLAYNFKTNVTFCDDGNGVENTWGLVSLVSHHPHAQRLVGGHQSANESTARFAAFRSSTTPVTGEWSFSVNELTLSTDSDGPAADVATKLSFDNSAKVDEK